MPELEFFKDPLNRNRYGWGEESPERLKAFYDRDRAVKERRQREERERMVQDTTGVSVDELKELIDGKDEDARQG